MTAILRPLRSQEAARAALDDGARLYAGGTAIQIELAKGVPPPRVWIDLATIAGRGAIRREHNFLDIGAHVSLAALAANAAVPPLLAQAVTSVAAPAVRRFATLGGQIAGRTGCLLPALLALGAEVRGFHADGAFHAPLVDWLKAPVRRDAVLDAVRLPLVDGQTLETARKIGLRAAFTPSVIGVAGWALVEGGVIRYARLAVGGGSVTPARLTKAEGRLCGARLSGFDRESLRGALIAEIEAPDDAFRSANYRLHAAANALVAGLFGLADLPHGGEASRASAPCAPPGLQLLSQKALPSRWHVRPDGPAKIAGRLLYLTDARAPDMLVARILRAGVPHAQIVSIDVSTAEALPGVAAVVTHRDVPGVNAYGIVVQDQPAFAFDRVRFAGEPIVAVAARDAATAEAALRLIHVDYAALPVLDSPEAALAEGAPRLHEGGNLQREMSHASGDVEAAFRAAAHVVEDIYVTSRQMHGFMETEGGWAEVEPDGTLAVHAGGQHGARDRLQLSRILARPEQSIRVVTSPTGGGFGGKDELTVQPALALLALKTRRKVRLQLSRAESVLAGLKRNPMSIRMRTACDAQGRLLAQQVDLLADAGAYASLGPAVLETALEHAAGPYEIPHVRTRGRLAYTNNGLCGAFRGFGANQMAFAVERQIDRLAAACGLSPVEMRARNLRRPGTPGYLGQTVAPSERLDEMLAAAAADPLWRAPRGAIAEEIVGVGMAMNYHGNGLGSVIPDPAGGALRLAADGAIEAAFGLDEMGQGLIAAIHAAVSARLGVARADIRAVTGDTRAAPDSGSTTASRGTYVVWRAAELAAPRFVEALTALAGRRLSCAPDSLRLAPGGFADRRANSDTLLLSFADLARDLAPEERPQVEVAFEFPKTDYFDGNARFLFVYGACVARVAIHRVTGAVRVLDINQHAAAGPVLDVASFLGQQEGGAVQAQGFTLSEDALMQAGHYLTTNLDTYLMPTFADAPSTMTVSALEDLDAGDPFGPRGAGELGVGAVTPAICNAIGEALGEAPAITPLSPEAMLDILARRA